ncbi:MAG: hypothetical protein IKB83_00015 [Mycoplasmataceae bacterium]|nr:hypothetical protein [bacterium]MBR2848880.1 hypothetical protein [Mycoplasmataceae bacterium]
MKYRKEREFVKKVNEELKEEVIVSRIIILESGEKNGKVNSVLYEDRFGREFEAYINAKGEYSKRELKNKRN